MCATHTGKKVFKNSFESLFRVNQKKNLSKPKVEKITFKKRVD